MSAADSAHHGSACIATTEHMPTPTLTEVEIRRTDGSLHTYTTFSEILLNPAFNTDGEEARRYRWYLHRFAPYMQGKTLEMR